LYININFRNNNYGHSSGGDIHLDANFDMNGEKSIFIVYLHPKKAYANYSQQKLFVDPNGNYCKLMYIIKVC